MSKIRNRVAIKKKCVENGFRADDIGENPHSKGEFFSRLFCVFFDNIVVSKKTALIIFTIINVVIKILIILLNFNLLIGS